MKLLTNQLATGIAAGLLLTATTTAQRIIGNSNPSGYTGAAFSTYVPFAANDQTSGRELWALNLATLGVNQIADVRPGSRSSSPGSFALLPATNEWFFAADDGANGREIWRTNGTPGGTVLVADIAATGGSRPTDLVAVGGDIFFVADDGTTGRELWRTDGVTTTLARDIAPGGSSEPRDLVEFGGLLYFSADDGTSGRELWRSDGTPQGTFLVRDLFLGGSSNPREITVSSGRMFFAANSGGIGRELHVSDGTSGGTGPLLDIRPGAASSAPAQLTANGVLFFVANDGTTGRELWRSNGTAAGTVRVADIRAGVAGADIANMVAGPGLLEVTFVADNGLTGRELWRASVNATPLPELVAGVGDANPTGLAVVAGTSTVILRADDGSTGTELWGTDGTAGGTGQIADIWPGSRGSRVLATATIPNLLTGGSFGALFAANNGTNGLELWRTNGTGAGTTMVANIAPDLPGGRRQPTLEGHADMAGGTISFDILGTPGAQAALAIDFGFGPGVTIPGAIGTYLLPLTPAVVIALLLNAQGEGGLAIPIPASFTSLDLVAQAAEFSPTPPPPVFLLSDAAATGIRTSTVASIPGGTVKATGSYDDENHLYEVSMQLSGTPELGYFVFCNTEAGECFRPETGADYTDASGLTVYLEGSLPLHWTGPVQLFFVDTSGERHLVWESYC